MSNFTSKEDEPAIGRLTISWAQIELGLDCSIDIIHRVLGGQKIARETPRTSLYRKMEYIRSWAKTIPEPTFRSAVPILFDEITTAAETRHDMIHGIIIKQEEVTGEAEMVRIIHSAAHNRPDSEGSRCRQQTRRKISQPGHRTSGPDPLAGESTQQTGRRGRRLILSEFYEAVRA